MAASFRFSPSLKVQTFIGDKDKRAELASSIKHDLKKGREPFHILLTTYEVRMFHLIFYVHCERTICKMYDSDCLMIF